MNEGCYGEVPSCVSGHYKAKERPDSVVVKGRNEDSCSTAGSEYVSPSSLVQIIIYVIYVAANSKDAPVAEKYIII